MPAQPHNLRLRGKGSRTKGAAQTSSAIAPTVLWLQLRTFGATPPAALRTRV